jgi:hypothetical protein
LCLVDGHVIARAEASAIAAQALAVAGARSASWPTAPATRCARSTPRAAPGSISWRPSGRRPLRHQ